MGVCTLAVSHRRTVNQGTWPSSKTFLALVQELTMSSAKNGRMLLGCLPLPVSPQPAKEHRVVQQQHVHPLTPLAPQAFCPPSCWITVWVPQVSHMLLTAAYYLITDCATGFFTMAVYLLGWATPPMFQAPPLQVPQSPNQSAQPAPKFAGNGKLFLIPQKVHYLKILPGGSNLCSLLRILCIRGLGCILT